MTTPEREGTEQPSFERFTLGWRIPAAILEPLLHPAAPAAQGDAAAAAPAAQPDAE